MSASHVSRAPATTPHQTRFCPVLVFFAMLMSFPHKAVGLSSDQISSPFPFVTSSRCGRGCRCSYNATVANCSYANLAEVPQFPSTTRVLVLDWNHIGRLGDGLGSTATAASNGSTSSVLELISVSHNNVSDIAATALRGLRLLRQLRLDYNHIDRLPVDIFADTPSLGAMSLAGNSHLDMASVGAALRPTRLPLLRLLDLSSINTITIDGRLPEVVFSQLPALEHLILQDVAIANMSAEFFTALSSTCLTRLDLSGSSIGEVNDTSFEPLGESLEHLILDRAIISAHSLDAVFAGLVTGSNSTRLLSLSLKNVFVDDAHSAAVGQHLFRHLSSTRLKTLHIDQSYAGMHGKLPSRLLHPLKHLQLLTLSKSGIRSIPSNAFHGLRHLQTLVLRHNHLSCERQSDCAFMTSSDAPLTRLRTLDLSNNLLVSGDDQDGGDGVRFSADVFPSLVELDLSGNRLTAVVVGAFGSLARLQTLRLSDNPLNDIESGALDGLTALSRLELDRCARLTHLKAGALAGLYKLRVFSAHDSGLVHLHHAVFSHLTHLEELYLRNNYLGDQGESVEKVSVRQSRLRVIDLGSNRFKTLPRALLKNSPHLNALYVDNNRLSNCSLIHVLRRASDLEFVDLSENRLMRLEQKCFDGLAAGVTMKLAGNPFQCSCETAVVAQWLAADGHRRLEVVDRDSVTCDGPSELSGTLILRSDGSSNLSESWQCHWRADVAIALVVVLGVTVLIIALVHARRRFMLLRQCRNSSSCSGQNGSISSVTISNSCYRDGSVSGAGNVGVASSAGGGESNTRYCPLIEDDLPTPRDLQVPSMSASASRQEGVDVQPRCLALGNGTVHRKQQSVPANTASAGDEPATSCGEVDNEALLPCHVAEMEESV